MVIREDPHLDIPTPSGPMRTFVFRPTPAGRYPGIVLFSEIFQVTAPIRRMASQLAGHGFVVAVPEIFHELLPPGLALAYDGPSTERGNACKVGKPVEAYDADAAAAIAALARLDSCTGRVGVMGICIGGHLAFRAAMNPDPPVPAAACFYATDIHKRSLGSGGDNSLERVARGDLGTCELLMIWGRQDPHISREGRRLIYDALSEAPGPGGTSETGQAGANFAWLEFNAAHAFMRDEGPRYNPELASQCLRLVVDLFRRRLGEGDSGGPVVTSA
ncbi:MAG: dienelactone hydrolase family protein [Phycisphaerales bacterium]